MLHGRASHRRTIRLAGLMVRRCDRKKADVISLTFGEIYLVFSILQFTYKYVPMLK